MVALLIAAAALACFGIWVFLDPEMFAGDDSF